MCVCVVKVWESRGVELKAQVVGLAGCRGTLPPDVQFDLGTIWGFSAWVLELRV